MLSIRNKDPFKPNIHIYLESYCFRKKKKSPFIINNNTMNGIPVKYSMNHGIVELIKANDDESDSDGRDNNNNNMNDKNNNTYSKLVYQ